MDAKLSPHAWYAGLNERLMELGKEDPEVYKTLARLVRAKGKTIIAGLSRILKKV